MGRYSVKPSTIPRTIASKTLSTSVTAAVAIVRAPAPGTSSPVRTSAGAARRRVMGHDATERMAASRCCPGMKSVRGSGWERDEEQPYVELVGGRVDPVGERVATTEQPGPAVSARQ